VLGGGAQVGEDPAERREQQQQLPEDNAATRRPAERPRDGLARLGRVRLRVRVRVRVRLRLRLRFRVGVRVGVGVGLRLRLWV